MSLTIRNGFRSGAAASVAFLTCVLSGCQSALLEMHEPSVPPQREVLYKPAADQVLTSMLLDFEGPYDATFVDAVRVKLIPDPMRAGNHVLIADGGARINLASLVRGRDFGGAWDVVGVRLWSEAASTCEIAMRQAVKISATTRVSLPAGRWVTAWLDVSRASPEGAASTASALSVPVDALQLVISPVAGCTRLLVDDVALAQSRDTVCESHLPRTGEAWTVTRSGLKWRVAVDGKTIFDLPAAPFVAGGFSLVEALPLRAVFTNNAGSTISLDRTGRLIENGVARIDPRVTPFAKAGTEDVSPAKIEIIGDEGRIERALPGDHNNDGFDEARGCYVVHAVGGRATIKLTRQGGPVKWPVLEVLDLPPGTVGVWVAGELIDWATRADDGRVDVDLPIELSSPVEVQVRVK